MCVYIFPMSCTGFLRISQFPIAGQLALPESPRVCHAIYWHSVQGIPVLSGMGSRSPYDPSQDKLLEDGWNSAEMIAAIPVQPQPQPSCYLLFHYSGRVAPLTLTLPFILQSKVATGDWVRLAKLS